MYYIEGMKILFGCFQDPDGPDIYMRKNELQVEAFVMTDIYAFYLV